MKILIIQQKMIGDVLTSSILFEAIKKKYPNVELHYLINSHTYPVVDNHPFIDEFHFFTPEMESKKLKLYAFLQSVKRARYDVVIDCYGKLSSALISLYSRAKIKSAYKKTHTSWIYSHPITKLNAPKHNHSLAIENRMRLLECIDIPFENYLPKIFLKTSEILAAKLYLEQQSIDLSKPLYMISVLGSSDIKTYPASYMSQLLDTVVKSKPNVQILFNYIPKQLADAKAVYNQCSEETQSHIYFDVFGNSLREFLAILAHCDALVGNEGGANNMAKALDIPTFTIFSPYLNKKNWFGEIESKKHVAIHISDYMPYSEADILDAKKHPQVYYLKFKPEFIVPKLKTFLNQLIDAV